MIWYFGLLVAKYLPKPKDENKTWTGQNNGKKKFGIPNLEKHTVHRMNECASTKLIEESSMLSEIYKVQIF